MTPTSTPDTVTTNRPKVLLTDHIHPQVLPQLLTADTVADAIDAM